MEYPDFSIKSLRPCRMCAGAPYTAAPALMLQQTTKTEPPLQGDSVFVANADNFDTVKPFSSNRQRKFRYC